MSQIFEVVAERGRGDWWVLEAPEVGAVSQVKRLDEAADEMREAIAYLAGLPVGEVHIDVRPILPQEYVVHAQAAAQARVLADEAKSKAALESRSAARVLREQGLTLRDVGTIMGVSHQRAAQLLNA